jgi:phage shock protein C
MAKLTRPRRGEGRVIAGVAAAVADGLGLSRTLVRLLFVLAGFFAAGELAYLVLWVLLPTRDRLAV